MYSSGSTGRPKGIVHLQHDMAYSNAAFAEHVLSLTPDDICFSVPKMFSPTASAIQSPFRSRRRGLAAAAGQPKPQSTFAAISDVGPTVFFGLPTLYTALTKADGAAACDFSSLRLSLSAAEVLSGDVFNGWKRLTGLEIVEGLGSTEALHIYLCNLPRRKKLGAAGLRVPGYEVALKDKDGRPVGPGEEGILWVRGDSNTPLYWNRPDKTAETMREGGWIFTGDRFQCDADGFYFFFGPRRRPVKISGQWVYPLEIELACRPSDALECAVFATELADRRMTLKAAVVMKQPVPDTVGARRTLQDWRPDVVAAQISARDLFLEELLYTGTGKTTARDCSRCRGECAWLKAHPDKLDGIAFSAAAARAMPCFLNRPGPIDLFSIDSIRSISMLSNSARASGPGRAGPMQPARIAREACNGSRGCENAGARRLLSADRRREPVGAVERDGRSDHARAEEPMPAASVAL